MPAESEADLESFFDEKEFATCVETDTGQLFGNFNDQHAVAAFDSARINSSAPELECRTCDAEKHNLTERGVRLTIKGNEYTVREHQADGSGFSVIILDKDS